MNTTIMEYNYSANRYEPVERKAAAIPVPGLVLVGERGAYHLYHAESGQTLQAHASPFPTIKAGRDFARLLAPLADWTRPATELGPDSKLYNAVRKVYQEAGYYS